MKNLKLSVICMLIICTVCQIAVYDYIDLQSTTALCLDGTSSGYYLSRDGDNKKIMIQFQAGGWCGDQDNQTILQSCYRRILNGRGSSQKWSPTIQFTEGILSNNQQNNFKDWKKVFIKYCDGSVYQSSVDEPVQYKNRTLYFRGRNITVEIFDSLNQKLNMFTEAEHVVIGGFSAGALASLLWTNYLFQKVQNGKVWTLPDSGIFLDVENLTPGRRSLRETFSQMMELTNPNIGSPVQECNNYYPNQLVNCFFIEYFHQFLKAPVFLVQSLYDSWALIFVAGIECALYRKYFLDYCNEKDRNSVEQYHQKTSNVLLQIGKNSSNGYWAPVCTVHIFNSNNNYYNQNFRIPQKSINSINYAVGNWLQGRSNQKYMDQGKWPDNFPCSLNQQSSSSIKIGIIILIVLIIVCSAIIVTIIIWKKKNYYNKNDQKFIDLNENEYKTKHSSKTNVEINQNFAIHQQK